MKIFDLHADLGYDIHQKKEKDVLKKYHNERLFKGEVTGVAMASYFEGFQNWDEMKAMILDCEAELNNQDVWQRVLSKEDLTSDKPLALMSVEGMCGITDHEEEAIEWLYEHGIRLASLCWNDENELATGTKGNPQRGLSEKGKNVIRKMDELHMVIDVSHTNEKTFWDIMNTSNGKVIATHSNALALCPHPRNLSDEQIKAIAKKKGLIGMNSCAYFINEDLSKVNVDALAAHAEYIKNLVGIDYLACGFDFMDYWGDGAYTICDMPNASFAQNFIQALKNHHFSDDDIKKIAYQNVIDCFSNYLK
ncbi:MAG: dipeptidase [Traorella sp.]